MMLKPKIKYLMQQLTSWALKCFPDIILEGFSSEMKPVALWEDITSMPLRCLTATAPGNPFFIICATLDKTPSVVLASNSKHRGVFFLTSDPPSRAWSPAVTADFLRGKDGGSSPQNRADYRRCSSIRAILDPDEAVIWVACVWANQHPGWAPGGGTSCSRVRHCPH